MDVRPPNGFEYALQSTSLPGLVVVIILGALSVLAWTIIITKSLVIQRARRRNADFAKMRRAMRHPLEYYEAGGEIRHSPMFSIYKAGAREMCLHLLGDDRRDATLASRIRRAPALAPGQIHTVRQAMERAIGEMAQRLEERMNLLATCVSGAPFLGLLGTVWGVMDTFAAVASSPTGASLQDMAPGVSAALVTTVVGLLVAIPAMFGYNTLIQSIRNMVMQLDHYAAELSSAFERRYVNHGAAPPRDSRTPAAVRDEMLDELPPPDEPPPRSNPLGFQT